MIWDCDAVKCGFWVNESNSQGFRYILTLPVWHSYILTSFFTLFVKFSGEYLWATVLFIVHQIKASPRAQDDMYHQIQLVLRNTESQSALIKSFMQIIQAHKSSRFEAYRRTFFLIILASFYGLTLFLASTLSSYIITTRDTSVLAVSRSCGWIEEPDFSNEAVIFADKQAFDTANALSIVGRNSFTRSAGYSRSCYSHFGGNATTCKSYVKPTLPYTLKRGVPCPFSDRACNGTAISLDTGYLRSDTDLGINTRSGDSLAIRKVLTCVPVAGEQYATPWITVPEHIASGAGLPPGTKFKAYELGKQLGLQLPPPLNDTNYTLIIHEAQHNFSEIKYELDWVTSNVDVPNVRLWSPFVPIRDLLNRSADTTLVGLRSKMSFPSAITDPWFSADKCSPHPLQPKITLCEARNPYSFLACQEQYQFCHTSPTPAPSPAPSGSCTPLTGLYALSPEVLFMKNSTWNGSKLTNLNPVQQALYTLLGRLLSGSQLYFQLGFIGRENLVAREYDWDGGFDFGFSAPLPSDHWESEVSNWMNVSLSGLQRGTISFGRPTEVLVGGGNSSFQFIAPPRDPEVQRLCHKIKMQSAEHTSYSVTGMSLTLLVGFLCIVSNMFISRLIFCMQRRSGHGRYKRAEWNDSSAFQLLRLAAEGRGIGPWQGKDKEVPTLVEGSHLFKLEGELVRQYEAEPVHPTEGGLKQQYRALTMESEYTGGNTIELQTVMGSSGVRRYDNSTTRLL